MPDFSFYYLRHSYLNWNQPSLNLERLVTDIKHPRTKEMDIVEVTILTVLSSHRDSRISFMFRKFSWQVLKFLYENSHDGSLGRCYHVMYPLFRATTDLNMTVQQKMFDQRESNSESYEKLLNQSSKESRSNSSIE